MKIQRHEFQSKSHGPGSACSICGKGFGYSGTPYSFHQTEKPLTTWETVVRQNKEGKRVKG